MNVNNNTSVNNNYGFKANNYDPKEAEVAKKLGMSPEEFSELSESEKAEKVHEYNDTHPNDPIEDKGMPPQPPQNPKVDKFRNDIDWDKIKLQ